MLPGLTVGGIRYRLSISTASAQTTTLTWGWLVGNEMITTAQDFSPVTQQHMDWMEYGRGVFTTVPTTELQIVGGGDDGFRTTRSRRLIKEIEDKLIFAAEASQACTLNMNCSVAVALP
jgi:hypothetical protein